MAKNTKEKNPLKELTYAELEKESAEVLSRLNSEDLPLDEASKIYQYGQELYREMEKRLSALEAEVTHTIAAKEE